MKKTIQYGFALLAFSVLGLQARADVITFSPDGTVGNQVSIDSFNWKPGNSIAQGAIINSGLAVGDTFTLYYQAKLNTVSLNNNTQYALGVGNTNQVTVLAGFTEVVTSVSVTPGGIATASFALAPSATPGFQNYISIYANTATTANDSTGQNFNAGTLILSASVTSDSGGFTDSLNPANYQTFNQSGSGTYGGIKTVGGILPGSGASGAITISAQVTSVDTNYFPTLDPTKQLDLTFTDSSNNLPFKNVAPATNFQTGANGSGSYAPNIGAVNGVNGPDFMFQATANTSFTTQALSVPEPSTMVLTLIGFGGMAFARLRRRNAKVA